jgi:hypothetical protein
MTTAASHQAHLEDEFAQVRGLLVRQAVLIPLTLHASQHLNLLHISKPAGAQSKQVLLLSVDKLHK